jgi:osmoprotectant transport system permease protein
MTAEITAFFIENREQILSLTADHVMLTGSAIAIATVIGVGSGITAFGLKRFEAVALTVANLMQAVPSIALLGIMVPLLGIGFAPALVALTIKAVLPIYLNTYLGLRSLPPTLLEADLGLGLRPLQSLLIVRLPLASGVIVAGIRTATVEGIAVTTLAAFIGAGGLGDLILQGIAMMDPVRLLAGALPAAGLAIAAELILASSELMLKRRFGR